MESKNNLPENGLHRYGDEPTVPLRAHQLWIMLSCLAENRRSTRYGLVADRLGWKGAGTMGQFLAPIYYFCKENFLPPLSVLVVNEDSGLPGEGFANIDASKAREIVFDFPWHDFAPPSPEELKAAWDRGRMTIGG